MCCWRGNWGLDSIENCCYRLRQLIFNFQFWRVMWMQRFQFLGSNWLRQFRAWIVQSGGLLIPLLILFGHLRCSTTTSNDWFVLTQYLDFAVINYAAHLSHKHPTFAKWRREIRGLLLAVVVLKTILVKQVIRVKDNVIWPALDVIWRRLILYEWIFWYSVLEL